MVRSSVLRGGLRTFAVGQALRDLSCAFHTASAVTPVFAVHQRPNTQPVRFPKDPDGPDASTGQKARPAHNGASRVGREVASNVSDWRFARPPDPHRLHDVAAPVRCDNVRAGGCARKESGPPVVRGRSLAPSRPAWLAGDHLAIVASPRPGDPTARSRRRHCVPFARSRSGRARVRGSGYLDLTRDPQVFSRHHKLMLVDAAERDVFDRSCRRGQAEPVYDLSRHLAPMFRTVFEFHDAQAARG